MIVRSSLPGFTCTSTEWIVPMNANGEISSAPSTSTASIACTMSSPVTSSGPVRKERQGFCGMLRSYA